MDSEASFQSIFESLDTIEGDESLNESKKSDSLQQIHEILRSLIKEKLCERCGSFCSNLKSCESCIRNFLDESEWDSGNEQINDIIKTYQKKFIRPDYIVEWIPYNVIQDIVFETEGGTYYKAKGVWREGRYTGWDSEGLRLRRFGPHSVTFKYLNKSSADQDQWIQEIKAHLSLTTNMSPVIRCYGITKDENDNFMIVTEDVETNLQKYLQKNISSLNWAKKYGILLKILDSLASIHNNKLIHGGLNTVVIKRSKNEMWLIGDLKHCRPVDSPLNQRTGTEVYIAPEHLNEQNVPMTTSSDIYSFGMIMFEISTGSRPFEEEGQPSQELLKNIVDGLRPSIFVDTPSHYSELMKKCWDPDPGKRPKLVEIQTEIKKTLDDFYSNKMSDEESSKMKQKIVVQKVIQVVSGYKPNEGYEYIPIIEYSRISEEIIFDGVGNIGFALVSFNAATPTKCAIKTLRVDKRNKSKSSEDNKGLSRLFLKLFREKINGWKHIYQHKNIAEFLGIGVKGENKVFLILPFANGGNLRKYIKNGKLTFEEKIKIAKDVADGVTVLHMNNIIHQNINPTNVLIFDGTAKVSNLPLPYSNKEILKNRELYIDKSIFDNIGYIDPDSVLDKSQTYRISTSSDIYSLGSLLWEIMSEEIPYAKYRNQEGGILKLIKSIKEGKREDTIPNVPEFYTKLYEDCWDGNGNNRPTIQDVHKRILQG